VLLRKYIVRNSKDYKTIARHSHNKLRDMSTRLQMLYIKYSSSKKIILETIECLTLKNVHLSS